MEVKVEKTPDEVTYYVLVDYVARTTKENSEVWMSDVHHFSCCEDLVGWVKSLAARILSQVSDMPQTLRRSLAAAAAAGDPQEVSGILVGANLGILLRSGPCSAMQPWTPSESQKIELTLRESLK